MELCPFIFYIVVLSGLVGSTQAKRRLDQSLVHMQARLDPFLCAWHGTLLEATTKVVIHCISSFLASLPTSHTSGCVC